MKSALQVLIVSVAVTGSLWFYLLAMDNQRVAELTAFVEHCERDPGFWQCTPENLEVAYYLLTDKRQ